MFEELLPYKYHNNNITINIKVVPKSNIKFGAIIQFNNNYWKIHLNSEPKDGKANAE